MPANTDFVLGLLATCVALLLLGAWLRYRKLPGGLPESRMTRAMPAVALVVLFIAVTTVPLFMQPYRALEPVPFELRMTVALGFAIASLCVALLLSRTQGLLAMSAALAVGLSLGTAGQLSENLLETVNARSVRSSRTYSVAFTGFDEHRVRKARSSFYVLVESPALNGRAPSPRRLLVSTRLHALLKREAVGEDPWRKGQLLEVTESTGWLGLSYVASVRRQSFLKTAPH